MTVVRRSCCPGKRSVAFPSLKHWQAVADLEGGPSRLLPRPFGRQTDAVTHSHVKLMPNFDRSTVKHGTQNIQNDCHQWLSDVFKVHQIRFRPGLCPGPHWGSLQRSPRRPSSWFNGSYFYVEGEKGKGKKKGTAPLSQIPGSAPDKDAWCRCFVS